MNTLASSAGCKPIIDRPPHIVDNSSLFIDLIFCNKRNLILNLSFDLSILDKCHHNIIFSKINIRISLSSSYVCELWGYNSNDIKILQKAFLTFDCKKRFSKSFCWQNN